MEYYGIFLPLFVITVLTSVVSARAVNISNTWMLPEEGFPVFFRYFRDRISWYEADAVCQFHHANLVTADSTSQYDAIRAYLKELDITENIWIGLSKTTERTNFQWTNFQPLNGEGHWQQPIPRVAESICVAMDPAADFLWKPLTCGGPDVASFICELPVPSWALGPKGCLLTELPSLTVLYIPEQLALELTSDCGLDGTKRIICKGDADREDILKQLSCSISDDFDDKPTKLPLSSTDLSPDDTPSKSTKAWTWTSNTIDVDYDMPTRHRRETEDTLSPSSTRSTTELLLQKSKLTTAPNAETTSSTPEEVTLDLITHKTSEVTEEFLGTTEESKFGDVEDTAEYPSAIAQGQLFSIIENGTMFDVIELNETTSSDVKTDLTTSKSPEITDFYTTVIYHKEPPSDTNFVTNKSIKKDNKTKKVIKDAKKSKSKVSKEEAFPVVSDSFVALNRTFRKELPENQDNLDFIGKHEHVEIKWGNNNNTDMKMFITTKRVETNMTNTIETLAKEEFLPKSLIGETVETNSVSSDSVEPEPEAQPRPNRQRQLTRPQRRSFYPYFFSRVLG